MSNDLDDSLLNVNKMAVCDFESMQFQIKSRIAYLFGFFCKVINDSQNHQEEKSRERNLKV